MTAMTNVAVPVDEWTLAHTAGADGSITVQNRAACDLLVRIGAAAATTDAADAAAEALNPGEFRVYVLASGDKLLLRPLRDVGGIVTLRS